MTDFWLYVNLGFKHVLDWNGYDHVLFLVVLISGYQFSQWQRILGLVTAFTAGHMASLFLATFGVIAVNPAAVEFLIPLTILFTAVYHIYLTRNADQNQSALWSYIFTLFFGLIHGLGFANFFSSLDQSAVLPLFQFAIGIEAAQLVAVAIALGIAFIARNFIGVSKRDWILAVCFITMGMLVQIFIDTWPF